MKPDNCPDVTKQSSSEMLAVRRSNRELRTQLKDLCSTVRKVVDALDCEMKKPCGPERGSMVAKLTNALEMQYDCARHFGLGESLKSDKRRSTANADIRRAQADSQQPKP